MASLARRTVLLANAGSMLEHALPLKHRQYGSPLAKTTVLSVARADN